MHSAFPVTAIINSPVAFVTLQHCSHSLFFGGYILDTSHCFSYTVGSDSELSARPKYGPLGGTGLFYQCHDGVQQSFQY